ncbi:MAG TPA: NUDIX domain-containing protein [Dactylosporangium sp.]|jgi:8-oxo-dGTP pyrophosphatase MutT (NUDIX family)|uniref:Nudix hydrolase domain-containing protein n=1 Tax=Dactylosporangium darangshiense TaxID=579108 RepID=A0ABP8D5F8_9ACTN|nr:NUDIX domain-containing protein [Dactylosporangium sp.]
MTEAAAEIDRRAARVLLLDPSGRVLLLRGCDPARPEHRYWFTVGGGLEAGESLADAAVREVYEETGLRITADDLVGPVRTDRVEFPFDGRWYSQEQSFFVVRADAFTADLTHLDDYEVTSVDSTRWWSADELAATGERFYPGDLADLVREVG